MTPGDTLPPAHCIIDLFSSLGFPDLETGSCRWGSSNCGVFFPPRGVLPTVEFVFLLSAFRIWKQGRAGGVFFAFFLLSAFRIWKQGRAGGGLLPRLPPAHICIIDLFSSLGFPDLETGSCRWGSSNCRFPPLPTRRTPLFRRGCPGGCRRTSYCGEDFSDAFHGPPPGGGASRRRAVVLWWSSSCPTP